MSNTAAVLLLFESLCQLLTVDKGSQAKTYMHDEDGENEVPATKLLANQGTLLRVMGEMQGRMNRGVGRSSAIAACPVKEASVQNQPC